MNRPIRLAGACMLIALAATPAHARDADEDSVKAAIVYNLLKFVELPRGANEPKGVALRLCLLDATVAQESALRTLNGRSVQGRIISVVDYAANACHVVYAGNGVGAGRLRALADQGVLTIDGPAAIDNEGIVGLVTLDQRIRFEFNLDSARRANIRIPAQLLKLASRIKAD